MAEFGDFVSAVLEHWVSLMSGIVSLGMAIWLRLRQRKSDISGVAFWLIAAMCLIAAFYSAWRDENKARQALLRQVTAERQLNEPHLSGTVDQIMVGNMTLNRQKMKKTPTTIALLQVTIRNKGAASIAEDWALTYESDSLRTYFTPTFFPQGFTLFDQNGALAVFHKEDALEEKTVKPIERGGLVRGWLRFDLHSIPISEAFKAGTKYTISFKDIQMVEYSAEAVMTGEAESGPLPHFPGIQQPFKRMPQGPKQ